MTAHGSIEMPLFAPFGKWAYYLFWEPAHWIMQHRLFANVKPRAERLFRTRQRSERTRLAEARPQS